jgi:hypothetical protein
MYFISCHSERSHTQDGHGTPCPNKIIISRHCEERSDVAISHPHSVEPSFQSGIPIYRGESWNLIPTLSRDKSERLALLPLDTCFRR